LIMITFASIILPWVLNVPSKQRIFAIILLIND
jgi:hypothetical protein